MSALSVVCWKWTPPAGYRSTFGPETVNVLRRMVLRHYQGNIRFICVTDDSEGIDSAVEVIPDWRDFSDVRSPHPGNNPACYRRLRMFHPEIGSYFGERFVSLDLDSVIVGDVTPLWNRDEAVVFWGDTHPTTFYNGSMVLMTAGSRPEVWTDFDPVTCPATTKAAGFRGSDQGWISYRLGPKEAKWSRADGVYSYRNEVAKLGSLPANARIVIFHGAVDPWCPIAARLPFVQEFYK